MFKAKLILKLDAGYSAFSIRPGVEIHAPYRRLAAAKILQF
jgi:hypothetical protein